MMKTLSVVTGVALSLLLGVSGVAQAQPATAPSGLEGTWGEGSKLVHQGVTSLVAADKALSDSTRRGMDATSRRTSSSASAQRAASDFRQLSSAAPSSADAAEAQRWAALVQAAAAKWQGFQTQERDATRDLNGAIQQISAAQKAIETATAQVERGRQMIGDPQPVVSESQSSSPAASTAAK
jgi:hypothetical protein